MSNLMRTGGLKASLGQLRSGEFYICTDTNEVFVGTNCGNQKISPPYRQAILAVTQASTAAPVITEILNELGVTWTSARGDVGEYTITASTALSGTLSKIEAYPIVNNTADAILVVNATTTVIGIYTSNVADGSIAGADAKLSATIRVVVRD